MFRDRDGWRVQWREPDGKRRSRKFESEKTARRFELELELGTADKTPLGQVSPTFASYAEEWLTKVCRTEKAETQWAKDAEVIKNHLVPAFGTMRLAALRKSHLVELKAELRRKPVMRTVKAPKKGPPPPPKLLSPKTANVILALAKRMMTSAVDLGHLEASPWYSVRLYRTPERDFAYWRPAERDKFVAHCQAIDPEFTRLVIVACHTGLRLGELAALRKADLDFDRRMIRVRASYSVALQKDLPTKGKEVADVAMNRAALEALEPARFKKADDRVFEKALFWSARHRLGKLAKKADVSAIRFHDLRHTFASCLAMEGVSLLTIQKLLRHKSHQMTLRYAHLHPDHLAGATDVLCRPARSRHAESEESEKVVGLEGLEPPTKRL